MEPIQLKDYEGKRLHFIGIGGSSMHGLADMLRQKGYAITGSDIKEAVFTPYLRSVGIPFTVGHHEDNVKGADLVVYTAAVPQDNVELAYAKANGIPIIERSELLGQILLEYPQVIAIAGCHGKTTISSMVGFILMQAMMDPSIHIGGSLDYLEHGGTHLGKGHTFVVEACEYRNSYHHFYPDIALINNIDDDHLDVFSGMDEIVQSFRDFIANVKPDGTLFGNIADDRVIQLLRLSGKTYDTFGLSKDADYSARDIRYDDDGCATFTAMHHGKKLFTTTLTIPGDYNVSNAVGASAIAYHIGVSPVIIEKALSQYQSAERRFKLSGSKDGVKVYHDYAHHPTAIKACMNAARMHKYNDLWVVFEGDSYSRVESFFDRIIESLDGADHVIVSKIFAGRGAQSGRVDGPDIAMALRARDIDATYIEAYDDIAPYLHSRWKQGDMVLVIGSGIINQHIHKLLED